MPGGACSFCRNRISGEPLPGSDGAVYCSRGCRRVATERPTVAQSDPESDSASDAAPATGRGNQVEGTTDGVDSVVYLQVDGMHSVTCEAFLESIAIETPGVGSADASYITETIRVEYDPDEITVEELCDSLSPVGYTAIPRETLSTVADDQDTHI